MLFEHVDKKGLLFDKRGCDVFLYPRGKCKGDGDSVFSVTAGDRTGQDRK